MKRRHYKVELVTEFAKDLVYEGRLASITQEKIFAEQHWRVERLRGHVDYVITDSPILLSAIYKTDSLLWSKYVVHTFHEYNNYNIFVERPDTYQEYGREHTLTQARALDQEIYNMIQHMINMKVKKDNFNADQIMRSLHDCS